MLRLEEAHGQKHEFGLDNLGLAFLDHNRTTTVGVGPPVDFLNFYTCQFAVLAEKLQRVDIPAAGAALFVTRCGMISIWVTLLQP